LNREDVIVGQQRPARDGLGGNGPQIQRQRLGRAPLDRPRQFRAKGRGGSVRLRRRQLKVAPVNPEIITLLLQDRLLSRARA
jgi:hypothetical protein